MDYKGEIQKNREYWDAVLGKEVCGKIIREDICEEKRYSDPFEEEVFVLDILCEELFEEEKGWEEYFSEGIFGNFYRFFGRLAVSYGEKPEIMDEDNFRTIILSNFYSSVAWIPIRVLIQDIHSHRERGILRGTDPEEQYRDYQERHLHL